MTSTSNSTNYNNTTRSLIASALLSSPTTMTTTTPSSATAFSTGTRASSSSSKKSKSSKSSKTTSSSGKSSSHLTKSGGSSNTTTKGMSLGSFTLASSLLVSPLTPKMNKKNGSIGTTNKENKKKGSKSDNNHNTRSSSRKDKDKKRSIATTTTSLTSPPPPSSSSLMVFSPPTSPSFSSSHSDLVIGDDSFSSSAAGGGGGGGVSSPFSPRKRFLQHFQRKLSSNNKADQYRRIRRFNMMLEVEKNQNKNKRWSRDHSTNDDDDDDDDLEDSAHDDESQPKSKSKSKEKNVVQWLQDVCPVDVLPKILAYAGPQTARTMSQTSKFFHREICGTGGVRNGGSSVRGGSDNDQDNDRDIEDASSSSCNGHGDNSEQLWKIMCEELYKWKPGQTVPSSWKDYYRCHPCIPIDFKSIQSALDTVARSDDDDDCDKYEGTSSSINDDDDTNAQEQKDNQEKNKVCRNICILVRPGKYYLHEAIHIETTNRMIQVSIQGMEMPSNLNTASSSSSSSSKALTSAFHHPATRICKPSSHPSVHHMSLGGTGTNPFFDKASGIGNMRTPPATFVMKAKGPCRSRNEPLIRVVKGQVHLENLRLRHHSLGTDIWNGNAAIQIREAPFSNSHDNNNNNNEGNGADHGANGLVRLPTLPHASVTLNRSEVTSTSGRGVVAMDDAFLFVQDSYVHDCAATGIYVGGMFSRAHIVDCDIVNNGIGNHRSGGVARGHSGIYVEQGRVELEHCNVSQNTGSGVSVIASNHNALEITQNCHIIANGGSPVELPIENLDRHNIASDNRISVTGAPPAPFSSRLQAKQLLKQQERAAMAAARRSKRGGSSDNEVMRDGGTSTNMNNNDESTSHDDTANCGEDDEYHFFLYAGML